MIFGSIHFYPAAPYSLADAEFHRTAGETSICTQTEFGYCTVLDCMPGPPVPGSPPDAGTITISSPETGFQAALVPASGEYGRFESHEAAGAFKGGETASIVAAGGEVPAFSSTFSFPLSLLLTTPDFGTDLSKMTVPRTQDLTLAWDRGLPGVLLRIETIATSSRALYCEVPSETGTVTVPAAALGMMAAGAELTLLTDARQAITAGAYAIELSAIAAVVTPDRMRRTSFLLE